MRSKREEQEQVEDEQEEEVDHHQDLQNIQGFQEHPSIIQQIQDQNMGINDYSYMASSEVSLILQPRQ